MSQELAVTNCNQVSKEVVEAYLFSSNQKLTPQQKSMFLNLALQFNLNPFKREIYAIQYGSGWNYVTGYQVYIARAEKTGLLNGWTVEPIKEGNQLIGAKATIYRKDWERPFVWEVSLSEFNRQSPNWKAMPEFMIKKVCMAQAFRLCFPNEFQGMPYIIEEVESQAIEEPAEKDPIVIEEPKQNPQLNEKQFIEEVREQLSVAADLETLKSVWQLIVKSSHFAKLSEAEREKIRRWKEMKKEALQKAESIPAGKTTQVEL